MALGGKILYFLSFIFLSFFPSSIFIFELGIFVPQCESFCRYIKYFYSKGVKEGRKREDKNEKEKYNEKNEKEIEHEKRSFVLNLLEKKSYSKESEKIFLFIFQLS